MDLFELYRRSNYGDIRITEIRIREKFELQKGNYKSFTVSVTLNLFELQRFELKRNLNYRKEIVRVSPSR